MVVGFVDDVRKAKAAPSRPTPVAATQIETFPHLRYSERMNIRKWNNSQSRVSNAITIIT
jgi:hypothetical protein